ncbi:hypothetical protein [Rhizobium tropici]|uniref:hypothetical protein n=1 Tax=Rhizobium tropici TaxID=398 RepID=UPI001FEE9B1C|nr:hypothetical protein [Rhizobium tropici]
MCELAATDHQIDIVDTSCAVANEHLTLGGDRHRPEALLKSVLAILCNRIDLHHGCHLNPARLDIVLIVIARLAEFWQIDYHEKQIHPE